MGSPLVCYWQHKKYASTKLTWIFWFRGKCTYSCLQDRLIYEAICCDSNIFLLYSIHTRANFMAPFFDLKGCAADELGRNKTWILSARMVVVDTEHLCDTARAWDLHASCKVVFCVAAAPGKLLSWSKEKGIPCRKEVWLLAGTTGYAGLGRGVLPIPYRTAHLLSWGSQHFI